MIVRVPAITLRAVRKSRGVSIDTFLLCAVILITLFALLALAARLCLGTNASDVTDLNVLDV